MLLPQSSAFAALKNRLNSVSNIGLLHTGPRLYVQPSPHLPLKRAPDTKKKHAQVLHDIDIHPKRIKLRPQQHAPQTA